MIEVTDNMQSYTDEIAATAQQFLESAEQGKEISTEIQEAINIVMKKSDEDESSMDI
ncbi:methyl-accepting chemotaxis protein [Alkalithermobacter thermoalcaliphilus JW-YL-7 = DSM 7308]|uniref:Methyl-accepting chemotaxis protein n=1 Tax=Alkalithermobacter thermoalcaliphilus JW-YL-7 = DSM 7308 TaxID=1121328 RepID=A0A150FSU7_CLOPD|nr:hypothetical protein JWYL7_1772 [[Clostridium] paradoxum JW-YL-7 = DSM 7308]SHL34155.1 methyl-accepting chemotaxis protein [[Clostridium] paradoxum JW-YL-7 = DSM 7308]